MCIRDRADSHPAVAPGRMHGSELARTIPVCGGNSGFVLTPLTHHPDFKVSLLSLSFDNLHNIRQHMYAYNLQKRMVARAIIINADRDHVLRSWLSVSA